MNLGLQKNLSNNAYHGSDGLSKTKIDMFLDDEAGIEWAKSCPVDNDKLSTLDFGDAAHAIILEPDRLESDFVVAPKVNMRTNAGKNEMAAFERENSSRVVLSADEFKKLELMRDSVFAHPGCKKYLQAKGESEQSWFWRDPLTGQLCKCRPDRNIFNSPFLLDVKTTDSIRKFGFSVVDYRYYLQEPWYLDGLTVCGEPKSRMIFLVIQKTIELGRYPVRLVTIPIEAVEYGRRQYKQALVDYQKAAERGFKNCVQNIELPYQFNKLIME